MTEGTPRRTLLIVDDDEELLRSLAFGLSTDRWHCLCFPSWKEASQRLGTGIEPNAAIVDLHLVHDLPSSGFDVIRGLANRFPTLPILALTGYPDYQGAAKRCIEIGAVQFVRKPIEIGELEERLDQAIWIHARHRKALEAEQAERKAAEEQAAESIQHIFCPDESPFVGGLQIQQASEPAATVTGDYYDYASFPVGQEMLVAIGDAQGPGLRAALNAHLVGGAWRMLLKITGELKIIGEVPDPALLLGVINEFLFPRDAEDPGITLLILRINARTRRVSYANAGHPFPLVFRGDRIEELSATGPPLGLRDHAIYRNGEFDLKEGDLLLLYSDGVTSVEVPAEEDECAQLQGEGLVREVRSLIQEGRTRNLPARLLRHLLRQSGKPHFEDDCTVVTIEVTRSGGAEPEQSRIGFGQSR